MKKQTKKNWLLSHKKLTILAMGLLIAVAAGLYFVIPKVIYINEAANQASMVQIRELIIKAIEDLKKNVPVDPKTGDLYFPESKLFLPNPETNLKLTYSWTPTNEGSPEELSVSLVQVPGTIGLYNARNMKEMFAAVPKLQACSRGVKLVYSKFTNEDSPDQLKQTIHLQNGRDLYVYVEKGCSDLNEVVDLLKNIKPY